LWRQWSSCISWRYFYCYPKHKMHGQKKVKEGEIDQAKKIALAKKIEKYSQLMALSLAKRKAREFTEESLDLTTQLLSINPEFYTMWNFRREILLDFFEKQATESTDQENPVKGKDKQSILLGELRFTEGAVASHPKSYWIWNHRTWATQCLGNQCDWKRELELCNKFLDFDCRNFHCWNYRRYVSQQGNVLTLDDFKYTTKKIEQNFSNYSAWHRRSTLFRLLYETKEDLLHALTEEFEFVKQAFYTEPADQSAWFYHRWLRAAGASFDTLKNELQMCNELLEIEPESKWVLLTKVFILREMKQDSEEEMKQILEKLQQIDPDRSCFYKQFSFH